ncbi:MAG: FecR domain-containing protein [Planctomycetota bacterium]
MSDQSPNTIADRFEAYLLGQLDDAAMHQLEEELRNDPQLTDECIEVMATLAMVREQFRDQREQAGELTKDPTLHGFHDLLSELSAMEAAAETETVEWVGQVKIIRPLWQQWQFVVPSAIAALLAIAVILIVALPSNHSTNTNPTIANEQIDPAPPGPALTNPVATLTAGYDMAWDRLPEQDFYAGQRFTLTRGFAEITTGRGAVILLEAPCTIAFTSDHNTLQLDAGKLVGRCLTPTSRGFTVLTPSARVVDIGTEFGVVVDADRGTGVHVFEGEVRVASKQSIDQPAQAIFTEQAVFIPAENESLVRIDFDEDQFNKRAVGRLDLVDIVARGNGLGNRSGMAIDLATGQYLTSEQIASRDRRAWSHDTGMTFSPIEESAFIDSVFIIDRMTGKAEISSEGSEFDGFPTMPETINSGDANGFVQATAANTVINPPDLADFQRPFASAGREDLDGHYLVIHGGAGMTFDLQALRSEHGGAGLARFSAYALNIEQQSIALSPARRPATADIWVIVDGEKRFLRRSTNTETGVIEMNVDLNDDDRFMTLAVSHGGDGSFHDWIVFSRPELEIVPLPLGVQE